MKWTNPVAQTLRAGKSTFGCWLTIPSVHSAEIMALAGYDWCVLDTEHAPLTVRDVAEMAMVFRGGRTVPLSRIPLNRPEYFKQVLDAGSWGVVVPMVNTADEARQAAASAHYPPFGMRGRAVSRNPMSSGASVEEYYRDQREAVIVIAQIETPEALSNAEAIAAVDGVDVLFVGPMDLSTTMQVEIGSGPFEAALVRVINAAERHGKAPGILVKTIDDAKRRLAQGFRFVGCMGDAACMRLGAEMTVKELRPMVG
ncbi:MAG: aldolase/citrate lyase family protein [Candidatus Sumerlaeota bacterium]|nr:aldolase/citrate lyase family protein [Candidatus Sumerlaeota bacterium]